MMRSKILKTVIVAVIVAPFAYLAHDDAVSIRENLQDQTVQIKSLSTETVQVDKALTQTQEEQKKSHAETLKLEKEANDAAIERQRLRDELGIQ